MKPLSMTIEGLQSYREAQSIDFATLNGCGLFGIFGPTGSGKSTILDAMTLALFGRVTRASFKTQGIINSACDTAAVSLTFELHLEGERRTYRIERTYRRKKQTPDSCEARVSRLLRLDGGARVLADKAGEVDAAVENLLGLGFDDFTRAVVLPQNQFQEFLLLGKKEKSDMLERLFCLEEFGHELARKVAAGRRKAEEAIAMATGALKVLENSTEEAATQLADEALAAAAALNAATAGSQACNQALAAGREVHRLSALRQTLTARQESLTAQTETISEKRRRLAAAQAAEPIWPVWQTLETARQEKAQLQTAQASLAAEADQLESRLKIARQLAEEDRQTAAGRRQAHSDAVRRLEQAADLAAQLDQIISRQAAYQEESARLHQETRQAEELAAGLLGEATSRDAAHAEAKARRQNLLADPDLRRSLERWQALQEQENQLGQESTEAARRQTAAEQELARLAELPALREPMTTVEQAAVIRDLATRLHEGEPCPLCGSRSHPSPASGLAGDHELIGTDELNRLRHQLAQAEERVSAGRRTAEELATKQAGLKAAQAALHLACPKLDSLDDPAAELNRLHDMETELAELDRQLPELEASATLARQRLQQEQARRDLLAGRLAGREPLGADLADRHGQLTSSLKELIPDAEEAETTAKALTLAAGRRRQIAAEDEKRSEQLSNDLRLIEEARQPLEHRRIELQTRSELLLATESQVAGQLAELLSKAGLADINRLLAARLAPPEQASLARTISEYDMELRDTARQISDCDGQLNGRWLDDETWHQLENQAAEAAAAYEQARLDDDRIRQKLAELQKNLALRHEKEAELAAATARRARINQIDMLVRGNAFVEFAAEERLRAIASEATEYLETMTRYRYALELDDERSFVIRDRLNGGEVRQAGTLSGGETFMASLALALALSSQIQIRGQSRLEFFFLDEGFGSLDSDLLDTVMDALERISSPRRLIGLISHVPELRHRIGTRLVVEPAGSGSGSLIRLEHG